MDSVHVHHHAGIFLPVQSSAMFGEFTVGNCLSSNQRFTFMALLATIPPDARLVQLCIYI